MTPDRDPAIAMLRAMIRIRRLEERCAEDYAAGKIRGFLHLYIGEEAIAAGVIPWIPRIYTHTTRIHRRVRRRFSPRLNLSA